MFPDCVKIDCLRIEIFEDAEIKHDQKQEEETYLS